jgi:hypothetical protein
MLRNNALILNDWLVKVKESRASDSATHDERQHDPMESVLLLLIEDNPQSGKL